MAKTFNFSNKSSAIDRFRWWSVHSDKTSLIQLSRLPRHVAFLKTVHMVPSLFLHRSFARENPVDVTENPRGKDANYSEWLFLKKLKISAEWRLPVIKTLLNYVFIFRHERAALIDRGTRRRLSLTSSFGRVVHLPALLSAVGGSGAHIVWRFWSFFLFHSLSFIRWAFKWKDKRKHFVARLVMKRHVQCVCEHVLFQLLEACGLLRLLLRWMESVEQETPEEM